MCWRGQDCFRWVLVSTGEERIQLCDLWSLPAVTGWEAGYTPTHGDITEMFTHRDLEDSGRFLSFVGIIRKKPQKSVLRLHLPISKVTLKGSVRWTTQTSVRVCCFYISLIYCIYNFVDNTNSIKSEEKKHSICDEQLLCVILITMWTWSVVAQWFLTCRGSDVFDYCGFLVRLSCSLLELSLITEVSNSRPLNHRQTLSHILDF